MQTGSSNKLRARRPQRKPRGESQTGCSDYGSKIIKIKKKKKSCEDGETVGETVAPPPRGHPVLHLKVLMKVLLGDGARCGFLNYLYI